MKSIDVLPQKLSDKRFIFFASSSLCLIVIIFYLISCSKSQPTQPVSAADRTAAWNEDIDYLSSQLIAKQYNLFGLIPQAEFNSKIKSIKDSVSAFQDYEIIFKMQQLIASFGVAHTTITPGSISKSLHFLPLTTYYFPDGLYIISANNNYSNLLGKKVIGVNGTDISIVFDSLKTIISHENNYWVKALFPNMLNCIEILKYFGFANTLSSVNLEVEGIGEVSINSLRMGISNNIKNLIDGIPTPLYMQNSNLYYWYTFLDSTKTLYLKYNSCENMASQSFADFAQGIQNFISAHDVEKFVIDFRNNGGGSELVLFPLMSYLQSSKFNQKGKLFFIIGRQTFSSAVGNATQFKGSTNSILVGEPTGGKPNSYGEVLNFTLPNSGVMVQYSTKYITKTSENPISLFPDYDVEISLQDYAQGKDPVLDFIMRYK